MSDKLIATTIRLEAIVATTLSRMASTAGQEPADYMAGILTRHAIDTLGEGDPRSAERLRAEMELKDLAIREAQKRVMENGFDPSVTLHVFQAIRSNDTLRQLYLKAIGGGSGEERGNPIKARINRSLGASIKTAVGAEPQMIEGNPVKVQVSNEFIFSYTLLRKAAG